MSLQSARTKGLTGMSYYTSDGKSCAAIRTRRNPHTGLFLFHSFAAPFYAPACSARNGSVSVSLSSTERPGNAARRRCASTGTMTRSVA